MQIFFAVRESLKLLSSSQARRDSTDGFHLQSIKRERERRRRERDGEEKELEKERGKREK